MIRCSESEGQITIESFPRLPLFYLDTCAIIDIAVDPARTARLARILEYKGTLCLSLLGALELSRPESRSTADLEGFFEAVGDNWTFLRSDFVSLRKAELKGILEAGRFLHMELVAGYMRETGCATCKLNALPSLLSAERVRRVLTDSTPGLVRVVSKRIRDLRSAFRSDPKLQGSVSRDNERFPSLPVDTVCSAFERLLARTHFKVSRNDAIDFMHTIIALAACSPVVLDRRWAGLARNTGLTPTYVGVYSVSQLDTFLDHLEAVQPGGTSTFS